MDNKILDFVKMHIVTVKKNPVLLRIKRRILRPVHLTGHFHSTELTAVLLGFQIDEMLDRKSLSVSRCSTYKKIMALWEKKSILFSKFVPGINSSARYNCVVTIQSNSRPLRPSFFDFLPSVSFRIS